MHFKTTELIISTTELIIWELSRKDPRKECPDLWLFSEESHVPFAHFNEIARAIKGLIPRDAVGNKTAMVAANAFQKAQIEMYPAEASILPFNIQLFGSRTEAVEWLTTDG